MINCSGNKIPLTCVFAAIAIVFIHGLSLSVAPSEPETREPEARAWAAAENEEAFYLEWTEGAYHHLRVMPLTEEYLTIRPVARAAYVVASTTTLRPALVETAVSSRASWLDVTTAALLGVEP